MLLGRRQQLRARCGGVGQLAAGLRAAAKRVPALRAARPLDPHRERQLLHGDDLSARAVVDEAAEQHPRFYLGAMSAVYGGAFHPSAEGHAVMVDAALPAVRAALGLTAPPEVIAQPLPPP